MGNRRSRIGLPKKEYQALCNRVLQRDNYKCRHCKCRKTLQAHHIIFRSHGGDDADWNLITICSHCHSGIHGEHAPLMLVILPFVEGAVIDANGKVKWLRCNGWKPKWIQ